MTKTQLQAELNRLSALRADDTAKIGQLLARLEHRAGQCAYCGAVFLNGDPAALEHWRDCEEHPARLELERLRALYNICRKRGEQLPREVFDVLLEIQVVLEAGL